MKKLLKIKIDVSKNTEYTSHMKKYFYKDLPLNADLKRHCDKEKELLQHIENSNDPAFRNAYQHCLDVLKQNKARLASKIGKK